MCCFNNVNFISTSHCVMICPVICSPWFVITYLFICYLDECGGNVVIVFVICSKILWPSWCVGWIDSFYGVASGGRNSQVCSSIWIHFQFQFCSIFLDIVLLTLHCFAFSGCNQNQVHGGFCTVKISNLRFVILVTESSQFHVSFYYSISIFFFFILFLCFPAGYTTCHRFHIIIWRTEKGRSHGIGSS